MIDDKFNTWLIEVNCNPDITTCTPVCARVIPPMIENALRIGLDPLFPKLFHYSLDSSMKRKPDNYSKALMPLMQKFQS